MEIAIKRPSYFLVISIIGLLAAFIGFAKTFFVPVAAGNFTAPLGVHIHGAFAFAWIILFVLQASLIHFRKFYIHQVLGFSGIFIAAGVTVTMIPAGLFAVQKELAQGFGENAYSALLGVITSGILFFSLVVAGVVNRNRPGFHKRYMLLATIVVLWPAWFRFRHYFPSVPRPEIWFALVLADSLIVFSWMWEKIKYGHIHPVLKYVGLFIILEQTFEVLVFNSPPWQSLSKWAYQLFNV